MPSGPSGSRSASPSRAEAGPSPSPKLASDPRAARDSEQRDPNTPPRLSLNHLKQGESHQRIRHGAEQLLRLTDHYSGYNGIGPDGGYDTVNDHALPTDNDFRTMTRLSHDIARDLGEISSLRRTDAGPQRRKASRRHSYDRGPPAHVAYDCASTAAGMARGSPHARADHACHRCQRVETPKWRNGPDGPGTLCNVCGLIYAKRVVRKKEESAMAANSASPDHS